MSFCVISASLQLQLVQSHSHLQKWYEIVPFLQDQNKKIKHLSCRRSKYEYLLGDFFVLAQCLPALSWYNCDTLPWRNAALRLGRPGVDCYCQHDSGAAVLQLQFLINEVSRLHLTPKTTSHHSCCCSRSTLHPNVCYGFLEMVVILLCAGRKAFVY